MLSPAVVRVKHKCTGIYLHGLHLFARSVPIRDIAFVCKACACLQKPLFVCKTSVCLQSLYLFAKPSVCLQSLCSFAKLAALCNTCVCLQSSYLSATPVFIRNAFFRSPCLHPFARLALICKVGIVFATRAFAREHPNLRFPELKEKRARRCGGSAPAARPGRGFSQQVYSLFSESF